MARNFPNAPQDQFFYQPGAAYQGLMYAHDSRRDVMLNGYIREVSPEVALEVELTVTFGVNGDAIGFVFDGVTIPAVADTDDNTSALALQAAIDAYIAANPSGVLASTSIAANVVTVVFADFVSHDIPAAGFATGTSAVAQAVSVAAASYARLTYGLGVTLDAGADFSIVGPYTRGIVGAVDGSSTLLGVIAYFPGSGNSAYTREALGFDSDALIPNKAHPVVQKGRVIVPWVGTLPTAPTDQVFWINDPAVEDDRNKFRSDANGGEADLVTAFVEGVIPDLNLVMVAFDL